MHEGTVVVYFRYGRQTGATKQRTSLSLSVSKAVRQDPSLLHITEQNPFSFLVS
jgi:hypothetical protein